MARFGEAGARAYRKAEAAAIEHVAQLLETHSIDADTHSKGETQLAHKPSRMKELEASVREYEEIYGRG